LTPTARQKKAVQKIVEIRRTGKTLGNALRESGYSEATAIKPTQVTKSKGFKEASKPFVDQMVEERQRLINSLKTKNLDGVNYKDQVDSIDKFTKNIQLLSGGDTERVGESLEIKFV